MQTSEYRKVFAISQSAIKAFRTKSLHKFKKIYIDKVEEDDDDKFTFGSLVDTLLLSPKLLNERFYIPKRDVKFPGDKLKVVIDGVYKVASAFCEEAAILNKQGNLPEPIYIANLNDITNWNEIIVRVAREVGFGGSTWSDTRIIKAVYEEAEYFSALNEAKGRKLISVEDNADALGIVENLKKDPNILPYFEQAEDEILIHQQEIFDEINIVEESTGKDVLIPLKGATDIIRINTRKRTVQLADLKTTKSADDFIKDVKSYDYIIQTSFYSYLIAKWLLTYRGGIYKEFAMEPPVNIAIDREFKIPYIYEYREEDLGVAMYGSGEHNFEGWWTTLIEIAWHMYTGIWDKPRELFETGKIKLKLFN